MCQSGVVGFHPHPLLKVRHNVFVLAGLYVVSQFGPERYRLVSFHALGISNTVPCLVESAILVPMCQRLARSLTGVPCK